VFCPQIKLLCCTCSKTSLTSLQILAEVRGGLQATVSAAGNFKPTKKMEQQDPMNKAKESAANVLDEAIAYFGKTAEASVETQREFFKMQSEFFKTWSCRWRGTNGNATPVGGEQMKQFQNSWVSTVDRMLAKRREVFEIQYRSAMDAMEGAMRLAQSANPGSPEEFGEKVESFCRANLAAWQKNSEAQLQEFQDAAKAIAGMAIPTFGSAPA
jgi:hypothetical protein